MVLADGPIQSLSDLKGKTIGYSVGGFETVLLKVMPAKAGLDLIDVKLGNHLSESWQLFIKDERKNFDDALTRRASRDTLPRFALRPGALDQ